MALRAVSSLLAALRRPVAALRAPQQPGRTRTRPLHVSAPRRAAGLLSAEQLFGRSSMQDYLRRLEREYEESLQKANSSASGGGGGGGGGGGLEEEQLRAARSSSQRVAPLVQRVRELRAHEEELREAEALLTDEDPDMRELAALDVQHGRQHVQALRHQIMELIVPEEEDDLCDLVLEVTAGVGGQEAMLFTAEVFQMYQGLSAHLGWSFDVLDYMSNDLGGLRRGCASISGPCSYKRMKFEGGVHRVQRVPRTEKQGRTHTSTTTVAVLPHPTQITLTLHPKDLRIETKRASGAGGQHVNTTDSAVRIVHLPTGTVAECQQERSQLKNKEKALKVLRARLYGRRLEEETSRRYLARKIQIGTKGRSEKIRTYNFPQDRVTDHRLGRSLHHVEDFLLGEGLLDHMNSDLQEFSNQEALLELLGENV